MSDVVDGGPGSEIRTDDGPSDVARPGLRVFCHINEFGELEYENHAWHRLVLVSKPLVVWAPSGWLLDDEDRDAFLYCVEKDLVHVMAREDWYLFPKGRESPAWPGARWRKGFDDKLAGILRTDRSRPDLDQRVRVVGPEPGWSYAVEQLDQDSTLSAKVNRAIERGQVPVGSRERALKARDVGVPHPHGVDPLKPGARAAAATVLRDNHNHQIAARQAGADVTLVDPSEIAFNMWLESAWRGRATRLPKPGGAGWTQRSMADPELMLRELLERVQEVLSVLDAYQKPGAFRTFVERTTGLDEFRRWLASLYSEAQLGQELDPNLVTTDLRLALRDLAAEHRGVTWRDTLQVLLMEAPTLLDLAPMTLISLAMKAIDLLSRRAQEAGAIPMDYAYPAWPFLYTLGRLPKRGEIDWMLDVLTEVRK